MRKAVVAKRKCATKVGGGGFVRHSLLHEGSRECDTRGAEYGLAPRRISKRGRSIPYFGVIVTMCFAYPFDRCILS